jgi:threonine dehydrogenase-like Zn-dependent dehydrogenase
MSRREYAIRFPSEQKAELIPCERDDTPPGPSELEGKTLYSLISPGTELNVYLGHYVKQNLSWGRFPFTPGYAAVCEVERVGEAVEDIARGDRVFCMGYHRSFQRVSREQAIAVPPACSSEHAPFARIMNITMSTLTTTAARPPARVLVTGLGPVGLLGALIFRRCGYTVIACDPVPSRREIAREAGLADVREAVPVDDEAVAGRVALHLECSGHELAVLDGTRVVRKKGELVLVGVPMVRRTELYAREILNNVFRNWIVLRSGNEWQVPKVAASRGEPSLFGNMTAALDWLADGTIPVDTLYHKLAPVDPQDIYQKILNKEYEKPAVLLDWSA